MRKTIKIALFISVVVTIIFVGGRWIAFWQIEKQFVAQIESLRESGITLTYKDLDINPWAGSFRLSGIETQDLGMDSVCHSTAVAKEIIAEGIRLLPLLLNHKLVVESLVAVKPHITYAKRKVQQQEEATAPGFLKGIEVHLLRIDSGTVTLINNRCEKYLTTILDIAIDELQIGGLHLDSLHWNVGGVEAKSVEVDLPTQFYAFSVKKFTYSMSERSIRVDSVRMVPTLDRLAFAQYSRHQTDQIQCTIPRIDMGGVTISESLPTALAIHRIDLSFRLDIYRDKRFPNAPRAPSILPKTFMHKLAFALSIDSLNLSPSSVTYEEVPETGGVPGTISFNGIIATIANITTDSVGESVMQVNTRFMDTGNLDARFVFPMAPGIPNSVQATLSNFSMRSINRMLLPLASLEIQSGELQSLKLAFQYDDQQATGELDLRYTNLKVHSVLHNKKRSTNRLVTLLINTMVQNNMDRTDQKYKRTGIIQWKRNPQAGLPSYWWKSILSGLKSVYSLEKVLSF